MTDKLQSFSSRIEAMTGDGIVALLKEIQHGVERESLRINDNGTLSSLPHPRALGSALTHDSITTDYSESLMEFITPPHPDSRTTLTQLADIHRYVVEHLDGEYLWPLSMPCYVDDENTIPLANYGNSNVGKMKRVYRIGLKNRYGSMMQVISGVHFNFSFSDAFWSQWAALFELDTQADFRSDFYFSMLRNYRRYSWLIPYLYGASPAICSSFLQQKNHGLPFEKVGKGTLYLPYATSLRMSDLGYTNKEQAKLQLGYNSLDSYVAVLREAMSTPSEQYAHFSAGEEGNWQQLSKNILQIENELYSSIRPKQPTQSLEKPTDALVRRGVSYIEVRALDVNPFSPYGIDQDQFDFLDVFLTTCLIKPSRAFDHADVMESQANFKSIVMEGRRPSLILQRDGESVAMTQWAGKLFGEFEDVAKLLDEAHGDTRFTRAVQREWAKVVDPNLTFSGRWLTQLLDSGQDNGALGIELAKSYKASMKAHHYQTVSKADLDEAAKVSLDLQAQRESVEEPSFESFMRDYYAQPEAKKTPDGNHQA